jgi:hypothetical protein
MLLESHLETRETKRDLFHFCIYGIINQKRAYESDYMPRRARERSASGICHTSSGFR